MKKYITGAVATAMLGFGIVGAQAADKYVGEYAGRDNCAWNNSKLQTQCKVVIKKSGKTSYKVDFIVSDLFDARKVVCKVNFTMKSGDVDDQPNRRTRKGLVGHYKNVMAGLWIEGQGEIQMVGGLTNDIVCGGKFVWSGFYGEIGD